MHIFDDFDGLGMQHQPRRVHVHVLQVLDFVQHHQFLWTLHQNHLCLTRLQLAVDLCQILRLFLE